MLETNVIVQNTKYNKYKQVAQLSQTDRAEGCVSFGQKWKTIFCRQYRCIVNNCDVNTPAKLSNSVKENKIRAITPFKVIQGH